MIQEHYDDNLRMNDDLRAAILAAWEAANGAFLMEWNAHKILAILQTSPN